MSMTAIPDSLFDEFITVENATRQRTLLGLLTQICIADTEFRTRIRGRYNTAGVTGRRRLCLLFAAVGTPDVLADLGRAIYPGDEWSNVRLTAIASALVAGVDKFQSELLFTASLDINPTVRDAANQALSRMDISVDPLDIDPRL